MKRMIAPLAKFIGGSAVQIERDRWLKAVRRSTPMQMRLSDAGRTVLPTLSQDG